MDRDKGKAPVYNHEPSGRSSPPQTPPAQTASSFQATPTRATQDQDRPVERESFPDTLGADTANSSTESGDERDPHDLSLSPKHAARTSIVDNMLLSLDQFSAGTSVIDDYRLFHSALDPDSNNPHSPDSESPGRYRGNTVSSSLSSENDTAYEEGGVSHYGIQTAGGRTSNSSSNYPSSPRGPPSSIQGYEGIRSRAQPSIIGTGALPLRERGGSKGSIPSVDFGPSNPRTRADSGSDAHSASLEGDEKTTPFPPFHDEPIHYEDLDAAPTPSVPAGPRRYHTPSSDYSHSLNPQSSMTPTASRKNSSKSSPRPGPTQKKSRPENIGTATTIRRTESSSEMDLEPPPTLGANALEPPAPSPTISYNKPAFPAFPPPAPDPNPPKERPGFFRRVFGSSKNTSSQNTPPPPVPADNLSYPTPEPQPEPAKLRKQSFKNDSPAPSPSMRQVVNKKSSFFRRRKKSVVDSVPPPITIPQRPDPKPLDTTKPEPSPVSSLRQVMNPFLADGTPPAVHRTSKEYHGREAGMDDADSTRPGSALAGQKKRGSSVPPSSGPRSRYPPVSLGGLDTSFGANGSGDETPPSKPVDVGGASPPPLASPSRGKDAVPDSLASLTTRLAPPLISGPPTSLSPVVEDFPHKSTTPPGTSERPKPPKLIIPGADGDMSDTSSNKGTISDAPVSRPGDSEHAEGQADEGTKKDGEEAGPTAADREQAQKLFDSHDEVVGDEPAAAWLGDPARGFIRHAYMDLFDWSNLHILASLRSLCGRLILKGETQQIDRVLDAFSSRWCRCNPNHGFKAADVVHTICYSILLLNTDLHLADIEQKMTRPQFVRNTLPTIHRVAIDAAPDEFEMGPNKVMSPTTEQPTKLVNRLSRADLSGKTSAADFEGDTGPLVSTPFRGTMRAWEQQVEVVLKEFYSSIQKERLPLFGAQPEKEVPPTPSNNYLGASHNPSLRRSPSTVSKSGSDIYPRGRSADSRYGTARWSSKPRSRARLYPPSAMGSSRTSLDDQASLWSPSASSTWSKYSLGKLTSVSVDSFGSDYPRGEYKQSIGFANALSQAIIREDSANSITSAEDNAAPLLEDETLQLAGAPWAKEGSLKHKHHLDSVDKRAKDRNWNECFAVIQQGWMRLFSFNPATRGKNQKGKRKPGSVVVGGGNWMSNAEEVWKFLLRQTIASALPPPGYSKSRPHVWALSLPTGAVHLFQVGTPEIVREFVSSANYWSARLSKQPLVGGISNIEYGWSDAVINSALIHNHDNNNNNNNNNNSNANNHPGKRPPSAAGTRTSIQSSIRSSVDQQVVRPKLPADRVNISDWAPPQQSMVASNLSEEDQLKALQDYVQSTENEFQRHNERRPAMILAFSPRHPNASKAMSNFERKSSYLLREIVKFRTYIDSLHAAMEQKKRIYPPDENTENTPPEPTAGVEEGPKEAVQPA